MVRDAVLDPIHACQAIEENTKRAILKALRALRAEIGPGGGGLESVTIGSSVEGITVDANLSDPLNPVFTLESV